MLQDKINLVIPCVAGKTLPQLSMEDMGVYPTLQALKDDWICFLQKDKRRVKAIDLYCGQVWDLYLAAYKQLAANREVELFIASAGLGFLSPTDMVPGYSATFSAGKELMPTEHVSQPCTSEQWFSLFPAKLPDRQTVYAVSGTYAKMLKPLILSREDNILVTGSSVSVPGLMKASLGTRFISLVNYPPGAVPRVTYPAQVFKSWVNSFAQG